LKVTKPNDPQISSLKIQSFEANSALFASSLTLLSTNLCFLKDISLLLKCMKPILFKFESRTILERIFPAFSILSEIPKIFFAALVKIKYPKVIKEVRGLGLLIGLQLFKDQTEFIKKLMENKLLTIRAAENVIRILPPLNVTKREIDIALKIIRKVCNQIK